MTSGAGASQVHHTPPFKASRGKSRNGRVRAGAGGKWRSGRSRSSRRRRRQRHSRFPIPPAPSSAQAITERADYNSQLQAQQAAIQVDPQGHRCNDCVNAGRNPHHFFRNRAFSECRY